MTTFEQKKRKKTFKNAKKSEESYYEITRSLKFTFLINI